MPGPDTPALHAAAVDDQLPAFIDEHREMLRASLEGLSEDEARRRLVPSATTPLGLLKHATFVERVWFGQAVTGRSRADLGIAESPEGSFELTGQDTIATVVEAFDAATRDSRAAVHGLGLDDLLPGNRRGPLPLRWVYLHVLREHAQHCGHADILREQILAGRA